jgi:hypothetical protein
MATAVGSRLRTTFGMRKSGSSRNWGLEVRGPFDNRRVSDLPLSLGVDPTGVHNLVMAVEHWPTDSSYHPMLFETLNDFFNIGVVGHFTPVMLDLIKTPEGESHYSFGRVTQLDGMTLRVRRFRDVTAGRTQYGFIDENGEERIVEGHANARLAYKSAMCVNASNPDNSFKHGVLQIRDSEQVPRTTRLTDAAGRLSEAGLRGEISFVEDRSDFDSTSYERSHVLLLLTTVSGVGVMYREDFVDGTLIRRTLSSGCATRSFDEHDDQLTAGMSTEREMYRRVMTDLMAA